MKIKEYTLHDRRGTEQGFEFWCPGCNASHRFRTRAATKHGEDGQPTPVWQFNSNFEAPSFTPSLWIYYERGHWEGNRWAVTGDRVSVCHLHLTAGKIDYLPDCQHDLAGRRGVGLAHLPQSREDSQLLACRQARVIDSVRLSTHRDVGRHGHGHGHHGGRR